MIGFINNTVLKRENSFNNIKMQIGKLSNKTIYILQKCKNPKNCIVSSYDITIEKINSLVTSYGTFMASTITYIFIRVPALFITKSLINLTKIFSKVKNINQSNLSRSRSIITFRECCIIFYITILSPIIEEALFRELIQERILKRPLFFKWLKCDKKSPSLNKIKRIFIASLLFSAIHISNLIFLPREMVKNQVLYAFFTGFGFGLLRQSKAGLNGAAVVHMENNTLESFRK